MAANDGADRCMALSLVHRRALSELRAGRKRMHWMWFVFPQIAGLGHSGTAQYFAIPRLEEAMAYLRHARPEDPRAAGLTQGPTFDGQGPEQGVLRGPPPAFLKPVSVHSCGPRACRPRLENPCFAGVMGGRSVGA